MRIIIGFLFLLLMFPAAAQRRYSRVLNAVPATGVKVQSRAGHNGDRTTAVGDTSVMSNIMAGDTLTAYYASASGLSDSGYATGTNAYNDMGFAEQFTFTAADSSLAVIGIFAQFTGTVQPGTNQTVTFNIWSQGNSTPLATNVYLSGLPATVLDSRVVPVSQLHVGTDSPGVFFFPQATSFVPGNTFFAGYALYYNFFSPDSGAAGLDTIAVECTQNGTRNSPQYTVSAPWYDTVIYDTTQTIIDTFYDTTVVVQNATLWQDGYWHDNFTQNDSLFNNLAIYPIVVSGFAAGVKGITRNALTFYGSYPNPVAAGSTSVHFSLNVPQSVSVWVYRADGQMVRSFNFPDRCSGDQLVELNLSGLAGGEYIYLLKTSGGDGFGGKLIVTQ